jgi:hypothetical protein
MKPGGGVHMHGRARLAPIQPPAVDLGQMPDQLGLDTSTSPDELLDTSEQQIIGERLGTLNCRHTLS